MSEMKKIYLGFDLDPDGALAAEEISEEPFKDIEYQYVVEIEVPKPIKKTYKVNITEVTEE